MVKIDSVTETDYTNKKVVASLMADTKAEVASATIVGLPNGFELGFGSSVMTTSGEVAFMKSDGTWNWL